MTFLFILAHSTDCQGLYDEGVPSYAMKTGRHVITVGLERTKDLKMQDIKVSWSKLKQIILHLGLYLSLRLRYFIVALSGHSIS